MKGSRKQKNAQRGGRERMKKPALQEVGGSFSRSLSSFRIRLEAIAEEGDAKDAENLMKQSAEEEEEEEEWKQDAVRRKG